jgi:probable F420-dependent oxidoreductase
MNLGVVFPHYEIGSNVDSIRQYIESISALGYDHIMVYDHVVGADISERPNWPGPYTYEDDFHEPFALFGYIAGISTLELLSGILILPQRQTVLVAKQAAEIDILSRGRLRLGVGIGWNPVEYESLGMEFGNRSTRIEEQIPLLRRLWTEPLLHFEGQFDRVINAGISPLPLQRPIPLWLPGAAIPPVLSRVARLGDGWIPRIGAPDADMADAFAAIQAEALAVGRDPEAIGLQGQLAVVGETPAEIQKTAEKWANIGCTHLAVHTLNVGLRGPEEHIVAAESAIRAIR